MKSKIALLLSFFAILLSLPALSQQTMVTGRVTNRTSGEALPGATVSVKGAQTATQTDAAGTFRLPVPQSGAILVITYIGMVDQEVPVTAGTTTYNIQLDAKAGSLNEVVVVGYGTQRRVNVTGTISSVKAKDLEVIPNGRVEQALQGRVSGVTIFQNSGQPGSGSTVRVRGITTFNNNNPLWVVDGVVIDQGGIAYLNQSDIESIEVLKDAASSAIYGTRAAGGVILVTTKKGKLGKPIVNYNGYYGTSAPAKIVDVLNATQYAVLRNESSVAAGKDVLFPNVASLGVGTNWQKAIFNNSARRYLHEVSLSGGSDRSTFYFSAGLQNTEGIVTTAISNYNKINFRLNSTHKISNIITFGQTLGYTRQKVKGLGNTNSEFGGPLSSALNLDPITPLVVTDVAGQPNATVYSNNGVIRDANGNPYGISNYVGQEMTNPVAYVQTRLGNHAWSEDIVGNAFLEVTPIKGLKVRSSLGVKKAFWGNLDYTPLYYLSTTVSTNKNSYYKAENRVFDWNIENTVTYNRKFGGHDVTLLAGQGAYVSNNGGAVGLTMFNLPISSYRDASFRFNVGLANRDGWASENDEHKLSSLFGRLYYSYEDRYLLTGIVRRDGSSSFGSNKKYGWFPSFSAGWNVNRESFWPSNNVLSALKLRGGYGVVGNDAIGEFGYVAIINGNYNYAIGNSGVVTTGYAPRSLENPDLHWEQTASTDIGFDAQLFKNFNLNATWFNKKTSGILRSVVIPGYVGVAAEPLGNVADMKNTGIELELGYHQRFGNLNISLNANGSYLKNTVTYVARDTNFIPGSASFQSMGNVTRVQVGHTFNEFWGYKRLGVFQNEQEIQNYRNKAGQLLQPNARPGDFIWADLDGDGTISTGELDKTFLGSPLPKYTFGFTLNLEYKGVDVVAFAQGAAGNKIFQGLRRLDILTSNYPVKALGRWHGEGTSTDYPRLIDSDPNGNFSRMSDFYLEDGDYLRLKVLQLGYTLPARLFSRIGVSRLRVYVTGENLLTLTKYTGYDPEVGGGVLGIDRGQYPQARSFLGGIQLTF